MKLYLSIDDTDDLESKGTGEIAEEIAKLIQDKDLGKTSSVTRHQLFVHDDIPYTSHNSSMCFIIEEVKEEKYEEIIKVASEHLLNESSKLADPGLCVYKDGSANVEKLIEYGKRAKVEVLTKEIAYKFSKEQGLFLDEYGGTGDGIIGALAGIGLRLSGSDGRFKGKLKIQEGLHSATDLLEKTSIDKIYDVNADKYIEGVDINLTGKIKTVLLNHMKVLPVFLNEGGYNNCKKEHLRKY